VGDPDLTTPRLKFLKKPHADVKSKTIDKNDTSVILAGDACNELGKV
jgi:hypothetical protein